MSWQPAGTDDVLIERGETRWYKQGMKLDKQPTNYSMVFLLNFGEGLNS